MKAVLPSLRADLIRRLVAAAVVAGIGLALLAQARSLDRVCPAIYPAPPGCFEDSRGPWSFLGVGVILMLLGIIAGSGAVAFRSENRRDAALGVLRVAGLALGVAALFFPLGAAFSGGFSIDPTGIALVGLASAVCLMLTVVLMRAPRLAARQP
ncbi:MAG: hypothetical protein JWP66_1783 [Naasia sp.]|nr:hypothetical protein [Naasia sp.]